MINNMMIGHQFIFKEFGVKPTIGWDIDTFGHSDTNNRLYAEMGFDAMFFSRLDRDEKDQRSRERKMTYLWRPGHNHFGNQNQILTYVFPGDYCYPEGFSSGEFYEADDVFVSDESLSTFNADQKMTDFINMIHDQYKARKGQNLLIPMGCDFAYQNAK